MSTPTNKPATPAKPENPPAFPQQTHEELRDGVCSITDPKLPGMTLRDYFAAKLISDTVWERTRKAQDGRACFDLSEVPVLAAKDAYMIADAMLSARGKAGEA